MDNKDRAILAHLQQNSDLTNADLANLVSLSASQVSRRITRLEEAGIISGYRAQVDARQLGLDINAFVRVSLTAHSADTAEEFGRFLQSLPVVRNAYALTGESDYLVHVCLRNLEELSDFVHRSLLPHENVQYVRSDIALDSIVENAPLTIATQ